MRPFPGNIRTYKMILEYDGTEFFGWQIQPKKRTIQEEIEKAIFAITGEKIRITGAGRTDTGVHALGQVASFQSETVLPEDRLKMAVNAKLPKDIRVVSLERAVGAFNARRNAKCRTYRYIIAQRPKAVGRMYAWYPRFKYQLAPMISASELLKGSHCWKAFCKSEDLNRNYISTVLDVQWKHLDEEIQFEITAERFFHNMVRIILGTLFDIGRGKMTVEQFQKLFAVQDRKMAGTTLPPNGLFLLKVDYPNH